MDKKARDTSRDIREIKDKKMNIFHGTYEEYLASQLQSELESTGT